MDVKNIKKEFPIFSRAINGEPLCYLDSASTTQKPRSVIDAITLYYETMNANIHRGIHLLSEEATEQYEKSRARVATFIGAKKADEIVFTKGATESINLVAQTWGRTNIRQGDEILVSAYEHHANLVSWQVLAAEKRAALRIIPLTDDLLLDMHAYEQMLSKKTKLVCITARSNVLGIKPPLIQIIERAHRTGAKVLVDAAQAVGHEKMNVQKLKADFVAFSGHKMLAATGVGVLYSPYETLSELSPYQFGGDMVTTVTEQSAEYRTAPWRFEAGTPNIAGVLSLPPAIEFLESIGLDAIERYDASLGEEARRRFLSYPQLTLFTSPSVNINSGIVSFAVSGVHPHDIATVFNVCGVAIRSGLHCAEPLIHRMGVPATARMSFYLYNDSSDIDRAEAALLKVFKTFRIV